MKIAHRVTIIALLWLIFVNPGSITIIDTERRLQMAHAWWTGTEEGIVRDELIINVNGKNYIPYDLGQSMLMLPGDWLGTKLAQKITANQELRQQFTEIVVNFLILLPINLLSVLVCFRLLKLFDYSEKLAGLSSIIWLIGTTVLFYTTFQQQNNQILLLVLISYQTALAYVKKPKIPLLAIFSGIALGMAFLIRITSILHAIGILVFLIGCITFKSKLKPLPHCRATVLLWLSGFTPFVSIERILTYYRYGSWTATSTSLHLQLYNKAGNFIETSTILQGNNDSFSFISLLTKIQLEGLLAPFFAPEKSIFLYDPLVLPCLIILFICWKFLSLEIKWYLIAVIIDFLLHLYIYSWTSEWIKQGAWGSRYHITSIHLLLIPLIPLLVRSATTKIKHNADLLKVSISWLSRSIIIFTLLIQFSSILLTSSLERTQQEIGVGSRFRVVQRLKNIIYVINYDKNPDWQLSKVIERSPSFAPNQKIAWNMLPFRFNNYLEANSSFKKFMPILSILWVLIFILAVTATAWMFVTI